MAKVIKNEVNVAKCVCAGCPSYNECAKGNEELLYCASEIGKSACEYQMAGCICGSCPVFQENSLGVGYYCLKGSAEQVDKKRS